MQLVKEWCNLDLLQPYLLVTIPRMMMTSLSFLSDLFIYKICLNNNTRPWSTLKIWASSHVTLVFLSRTFSNSTELVLFSALLYFVSSSMKLTDRYIRREIELEDQYKRAGNALERVQIVRMQKKIPLHKYNHSFWIGALFALGVFNRPTFMLYALVPMFFWMQRGMFLRKVGLADFHDRMSSLLPTFIIMALTIIVSDTLFYRGWTLAQVVMTPLNFIAYNMDRSNLARHGLHPWYLHSAINVPMLFNVLGLGGLYLVSRAIVMVVMSPWTLKPKLFDFNGLLIFSFAFPLLTLSLTPHQEPRFLLPLLVPLVLLLGPFLLRRQGLSAKILRSFWYAGNAVCVLFFGFFHQGGIYETQHWLHRHVHHERARGTHTHLLYFHTYMPPMSLLAVPHRASVDFVNGTRYKRGRTVFFEDLAGAPFEELRQRCVRLVAEAQSKYQSKKLVTEMFVVFPATLSYNIDRLLMPLPTLRWKHAHKSYPHLSMEDPPDFGDLCTKKKSMLSGEMEIQCHSVMPWLKSKLSQMALVVYKLQFPYR